VKIELTDRVVDLLATTVIDGDDRVPLTPIEVALLAYLGGRIGELIDRETLLREVWNYRAGVRSRAMDHTLTRLRAKVEIDPKNPAHLVTVRGHGLKLENAVVSHPERQSNLVVPLTSFVGRQPIIDEIEGRNARLITLHGPGGAGKSRIALQIGLRCADPAFRAELRDAVGPADVEAAVGQALGLQGPVANALSGRGPLLLILDTFETVPSAAHLLVEWLQGAPSLRILVTSRVRLGLESEHLVAVSPMEPDTAVALFLDRARAIATVETDAATRAHIAALVDAADRLPLAIELVAARANVLPPALLLDRSGEILGSLDATLQWSWDLLEPNERRALIQCSVFRAPFSLTAAEAIVDVPGPVFDLVSSLVDNSLIHPLPSGRFQILDTVRARLAPKRETSLSDRHARWFSRRGTLSHLRDLDSHGGEPLRQALFAELPDLLAAAESPDPDVSALAALAATYVLRLRGPHARIVSLVDGRLPTATGELRVRLVRRRALALLKSGRRADAEAELQAALAQGEGAQSTGLTRADLGILAHFRGDLDGAIGHFETALSDLRTAGDRHAEGTTLTNLGFCARSQGRWEDARALLSEALAIHRQVGNRRSEGIALAHLAACDYALGDLSASGRRYRLALTIHREAGDRSAEGHVLINLANAATEARDFEAAQGFGRQALTLFRQNGNRRYEAAAMGSLGESQLELGQTEAARELLADAVALCEETGFALAGAAYSGALSVAEARLGDAAGATRRIGAAIAVAEGIGAAQQVAELREKAARIAKLLG